MASPKVSIGSGKKLMTVRNRRRTKPKHLRHSKSLGPKSNMRGDRGKM